MTTGGSCCDLVGNGRSATRESERARRRGEGCTAAAWKKRAGVVRDEYEEARRGKRWIGIEWLYTGSGICIYDTTDLRGIERKWVKDRTGNDGGRVCDSISIQEAKGERDKTSQAGHQIGSCVSFRAAGSRVRVLVTPLTSFA